MGSGVHIRDQKVTSWGGRVGMQQKQIPHSKFFCAHTQLATQPTERRHQHAVKMP